MTHPPHGPVDFLAYALDNRVLQARIDLVDDRLCDMLARGEPIAAEDVTLRLLRERPSSIGDGLSRVGDYATIDPCNLAIVVATGPRGSLRHRVETMSRPVTIRIGGYAVHGYVHAPTPADPVEQLERRAWIPVTEAVLEHHGCGRPWRERFDALLVNRLAVSSVERIDETRHETHWLAAGPPVSWPEHVAV